MLHGLLPLLFLFTHLKCTPNPDFVQREVAEPGSDFPTRYQITKFYNEGSHVTGTRETRNFWYSTIQVTKAEFVKCQAIGNSLVFGGGGAIYTQVSSLTVSNSKFTQNSATSGGALAVLHTNCIITHSVFEENIAFLIGGAVVSMNTNFVNEMPLVDSTKTQSISQSAYTYVYNSAFIKNSANSLYGAVCLINVGDAQFSDTEFNSNNAGLNGGALGCYDSSVVVKNCQFVDNTIGERMLNTSQFSYSAIRTDSDNPVSRGGSAIVFQVYTEPPSGSHELHTESTCFAGNRILLDIVRRTHEAERIGLDVFFGGYCRWTSKYDNFEDTEEYSIGHSKYETERDSLPGSTVIPASSYGLYTTKSNTVFGQSTPKCVAVNPSQKPFVFTDYPVLLVMSVQDETSTNSNSKPKDNSLMWIIITASCFLLCILFAGFFVGRKCYAFGRKRIENEGEEEEEDNEDAHPLEDPFTLDSDSYLTQTETEYTYEASESYLTDTTETETNATPMTTNTEQYTSGVYSESYTSGTNRVNSSSFTSSAAHPELSSAAAVPASAYTVKAFLAAASTDNDYCYSSNCSCSERPDLDGSST